MEAEIALHREAAERARLEARAAEAVRRAAEAQALHDGHDPRRVAGAERPRGLARVA